MDAFQRQAPRHFFPFPIGIFAINRQVSGLYAQLLQGFMQFHGILQLFPARAAPGGPQVYIGNLAFQRGGHFAELAQFIIVGQEFNFLVWMFIRIVIGYNFLYLFVQVGSERAVGELLPESFENIDPFLFILVIANAGNNDVSPGILQRGAFQVSFIRIDLLHCVHAPVIYQFTAIRYFPVVIVKNQHP